jgi:hypothetical protein
MKNMMVIFNDHDTTIFMDSLMRLRYVNNNEVWNWELNTNS